MSKEKAQASSQEIAIASPISAIQKHFMKQQVMKKIASHCGVKVDGVEKMVRDITNLIREDMAKKEGKLALCSPESFVNCIYDAHALGMKIDGRGHCSLIARATKGSDGKINGYEAKITPGYKGYVNRLRQGLKDVDIRTFIFWDEEEFVYWSENGLDKYIYKPKKAARSDYTAAIGVACYISHSINGVEKAVIEAIDKKEILQIKSKAQTSVIWNEWFGEKMKVAAIRRACKVRFAMITDDLDAYDNENYDMGEDAGSGVSSLTDKLNSEKYRGYNPFPGEVEPPLIEAVVTPVIPTDTPVDAAEEVAVTLDAPVNAPLESGVITVTESGWDGWVGLTIKGVPIDISPDISVVDASNFMKAAISSEILSASKRAILDENALYMAELLKVDPRLHALLESMALLGEDNVGK